MNALATKMVSKMLSGYIEGITRETCDVSFLSGNLVLTDAHIKKAALEEFDLPFDVHKGVIDKLTLRVPWAHLKTRRAELFVEGVALLATPRDPHSRTWSAKEQDQRAQERKAEHLNTFEEMRASKEGRGGGTGWSTKLMELVVTNMRIVVRNVHVRFEDASDPAWPYALGIRWEAMTLAPVADAESNEEVFHSELPPVTYAAATLTKFTVYAVGGSDARLCGGLEADAWRAAMANATEFCGGDRGRCVGPLDLGLRLSQLTYIGLDNETLAHAPLVESVTSVDRLRISLHKRQYDALLRVVQLVTNFSVAWEHALRRPSVPPREDAAAWWRYAKSCAVQAIRRARVDQERMQQGKQRIKEDYVFLWKLFIGAGRKHSALAPKWQRLLAVYERVLPELDLISYRVAAYRQIDAERKRAAAKPAPKTSAGSAPAVRSWLQRVRRRESSSNLAARHADPTAAAAPACLPASAPTRPEDRRREAKLHRRRAYTLGVDTCEVLLHHGETGRLMANLVCKGMSFAMWDTKVDCTLLVKLQQLAVHDAMSGGPWQQILGPEERGTGGSGGGSSSTLSLVSLCYAFTKPASKLDEENRTLAADSAVTLQTSKAMRLILNDSFLRELGGFFKPPVGWTILRAGLGITPAAPNATPSGRSRTLAASVLQAAEDLLTTEVDIVAAAPTLVIPLDCAASATQALVVQLGHLRLTSRLHAAERAQLRRRAAADKLCEGDTHEWWDVAVRGVRVAVRPCRDGVLLPSLHGADLLSETGVRLAYGESLVPRVADVPLAAWRGTVGPDVRVHLSHASLAVASELSTRLGDLLYEATVGDGGAAPVAAAAPAQDGSDQGTSPARRKEEDGLFSPTDAAPMGPLGADVELETLSLTLELALSPAGEGEQLPVCVVRAAELATRCRVPREGRADVTGTAALFEVVGQAEAAVSAAAADAAGGGGGAADAVLVSSEGSPDHPLFSYTINALGAAVFSLHLGEAEMDLSPHALRRMMAFFAPYTVGVPAVQAPQGCPDAPLPDGDLTVAESCDNLGGGGDVAFGPQNRLLVRGSEGGCVVIRGGGSEGGGRQRIVLLGGLVTEHCIAVAPQCEVRFENIEFYCKTRLKDYFLPGSGAFSLAESCIVHSEAESEVVDTRDAKEWKPYSASVLFDRTQSAWPRGFGVSWETCRWSYSWDGEAVHSRFHTEGLGIACPEDAEGGRSSMLEEPVDMSYETRITPTDRSAFVGTSKIALSGVSLATSFDDLVGFNGSMYDVNESIYPAEAPTSVYWRDETTMTFASPVRLALRRSGAGGAPSAPRFRVVATATPRDGCCVVADAADSGAADAAGDAPITMHFETEALPGQARDARSTCTFVLAADVLDAAGNWAPLLHPCRSSLTTRDRPTGLPKGCGHWVSSECAFDLLDPAQVVLRDAAVHAFSDSAAEEVMRRASAPQPMHPSAVRNDTGVSGLGVGDGFRIECTDAACRVAPSSAAEAAEPPEAAFLAPGTVVATAVLDTTPPHACLEYLRVVDESGAGGALGGVYSILPGVLHNHVPVWSTYLDASRKRLLFFDGRAWHLSCRDDSGASLAEASAAAASPPGVAPSPLAAAWEKGVQVAEAELSADAAAFRARALAATTGADAGFLAGEARLHGMETAIISFGRATGLSVGQWIGYEPPAVLHYRVKQLCMRAGAGGGGAEEADDVADSMVDRIVEGQATLPSVLRACCGKGSNAEDVAAWSGDYPEALRDALDGVSVVDSEDGASSSCGGGGRSRFGGVEWSDVGCIEAAHPAVLNACCERSPPPPPPPAWADIGSGSTYPVLAGRDAATGVATVSGPVLLLNTGGCNLQLLFGAAVVVTLEPRMAQALPLPVAALPHLARGTLRVRSDAHPERDLHGHRHSTAVFEDAWSEVHLPETVEDSEVRQECVCGEAYVLLVVGRKDGWTTLSFSAPVRILNELPCDVGVDVGGATAAALQIRRGEAADVHCLRSADALRFSVRLACPLTDDELRPPAAAPFEAGTCATLLLAASAEAAPLPVRVEMRRDDAGRRTLRLHAPVWLVNATACAVRATLGNRTVLLPEGIAVPYAFEAGPLVEGVAVLDGTGEGEEEGRLVPLEGGSVGRVVVTEHEAHRVVMVVPLCVVTNDMPRDCRLSFIDGVERAVPLRSACLLQSRYTGAEQMTVAIGAGGGSASCTFALPEEGCTLVVPLGALWIPVLRRTEPSTGALHVTLGGRPPPPPLVVSNQSWRTAVVGRPPCRVEVAPFSTGKVYLNPQSSSSSAQAEVEAASIPLELVGTGVTATIALEGGEVVGVRTTPERVEGLEVELRRGKKGALLAVYDDEMRTRRRSEERDALPATCFTASLRSLAVSAGSSSLGGVVEASADRLAAAFSEAADGGVRRAMVRTGDATFDSALLRALLLEHAGEVVPFAPALLEHLFPVAWRAADGGAVLAEAEVRDVPWTGVAWRSEAGLRALLDSATASSPAEVRELLRDVLLPLLDGGGGGGGGGHTVASSWDAVAARATAELAALQAGDERRVSAVKRLAEAAVRRRYGVGVDLDTLRVEGAEETVADYLMSRAAAAHLGSTGVVAAGVARHLKVYEVARRHAKSLAASDDAAEMLNGVLRSRSFQEAAVRAHEAAATLGIPELAEAAEEAAAVAFEPDATLRAIQAALGAETTQAGVIDWEEALPEAEALPAAAAKLAGLVRRLAPSAMEAAEAVAGEGRADGRETGEMLNKVVSQVRGHASDYLAGGGGNARVVPILGERSDVMLASAKDKAASVADYLKSDTGGPSLAERSSAVLASAKNTAAVATEYLNPENGEANGPPLAERSSAMLASAKEKASDAAEYLNLGNGDNTSPSLAARSTAMLVSAKGKAAEAAEYVKSDTGGSTLAERSAAMLASAKEKAADTSGYLRSDETQTPSLAERSSAMLASAKEKASNVADYVTSDTGGPSLAERSSVMLASAKNTAAEAAASLNPENREASGPSLAERSTAMLASAKEKASEAAEYLNSDTNGETGPSLAERSTAMLASAKEKAAEAVESVKSDGGPSLAERSGAMLASVKTKAANVTDNLTSDASPSLAERSSAMLASAKNTAAEAAEYLQTDNGETTGPSLVERSSAILTAAQASAAALTK